MSESALLAKLATLNDSLDDLEEKLEPLLAQTLPESLLPLETIQQVKLNVALPYLVYDLIFIYLKTRGIDPKTHPVVAELDRVRQYFDKIKNAEDPEKRKTAVDKAAANRFIKHAIAQVREQATTSTTTSSANTNTNTNTHIRFDAHGNATMPTPSSSSASTSASASASASASSSSAAAIPAKVTSKMRARAEWQKKIAEEDHDEDEEDADALQVFDEDNEGDEGEGSSGPEQASFKGKDKGKGKAKAAEEDTAVGGKKRRRPAVDPFAGYGDDAAPKASKSLKKKNSLPPQAEGDDVAMDDASASGNATPRSSKKDKKVRKKSKNSS